MIKAVLGTGDKQTILLGLAFENLDRLREGQPIMVRGRDLGIDHNILIHANKDEQAIMDEMRASGLDLPEPTIPDSTCPDDDTLLIVLTNLDGKKFARCPQCNREFGVPS